MIQTFTKTDAWVTLAALHLCWTGKALSSVFVWDYDKNNKDSLANKPYLII